MRGLNPDHLRTFATLALVLRRDKPLNRGLREVVNALSALGRKKR